MTVAPLSTLDEVLQSHRAALLRRDAATLAIVDRRYRVVQRRLLLNIDALMRQMDDSTTLGQLRRLQRYRDLLTQVEALTTEYATSLAPVISAGQQTAVTMAAEHARSLVAAQLGERATWNTLPTGATNEMVGRLSDGSPLTDYLRGFGPAAATAAEETLIGGVATGKGTKVIAADLARIFGQRGAADPGAIGRKAMQTSRQAILGSYRSTSVENYKQNADILECWVWTASIGPRCCPVCISKHGTKHPVTEEFASHISCRCTPSPRTKSWAALGFEGIPETRLEVEPGERVFARLDSATQRQILGPTKLRMWNAGTLTFDQLVAETNSPKWGKGLREKSLREVMT